jgi:hypothetical protein
MSGDKKKAKQQYEKLKAMNPQLAANLLPLIR